MFKPHLFQEEQLSVCFSSSQVFQWIIIGFQKGMGIKLFLKQLHQSPLFSLTRTSFFIYFNSHQSVNPRMARPVIFSSEDDRQNQKSLIDFFIHLLELDLFFFLRQDLKVT